MPETIGVLDKDGNAVTVYTNDALVARLGEVTASPAANTTLGRLKAIADKLSADPSTATGQAAIISAIGAVATLLSGTLTISGTVTANTGLTQPLTDAELRNSAVPVSISGVATSAKQDDLAALVTVIDGVLDAILAKLTSDPSTATLQTTANGYLQTLAGAITSAKAQANATLDTGSIANGSALLTPKYAAIAASSSGNNTLVAAVSSKKIRVLAYNLMGNGAVNAKFQSGAGGTDLTGLKYIDAAGGGICAPFNPVGWFETEANTLLNLNLSGAVAVGGELVYVEV